MTASATPFLDVADRIGSRLCRDALWADDRCNWLGWAAEWTGQALFPVYRAQGASLYEGTAGIALFLSRLVALTGDTRQKATLEGALNQMLAATARSNLAETFGFFSGLAGAAAVCFHAAATLREERWTQLGLARLTALATATPDPRLLDVMSGSAGTASMLLHAAYRFRREDFLAAAFTHGDLLVEAATSSEAGSSWTGVDGSRLLGYAHGASGIACTLLELALATGSARYRQVAMDALRYERSHFSPQWRNWPDLRRLPTTPPQTVSYPVAWCHGATGIGFSRLRLLQLSRGADAELAFEIDTAVDTTRLALSGPVMQGQGYSLCHGAGGQADLLLEAAIALQRPALREAAEAVGRSGITAFHDTDIPWPGGVPAKGEAPGLMLGIAGIGYFYLRLHSPELTPSVLVLTPDLLIGRNSNLSAVAELTAS